MLLMFVTGFYYCFTKLKRPFRLPRQNLMENWSNFSALVIIFAANLDLNILGEGKKTLAVFLAFAAANYFLAFWLLGTFDIVLKNNAKFFKRRLFAFYVLYMSLQAGWTRTKFDGDLVSFFREYWQTVRKARFTFSNEEKKGRDSGLGNKPGYRRKYFKGIIEFLGDL